MKKRTEPWTRDHRLSAWQVWLGGAGVLVATAAIVVPLVVANSNSGGGSDVRIHNNNGQANIDSTVYNTFYLPSADGDVPNGAFVHSNSCPVSSPSGVSSPSIQALSVGLLVKLHQNGACFSRSIVVGQTPSTVEFEISYANTSNKLQKDVVVSTALPRGMELVPGTTYLANDNYPQGKRLDSNNIASGGIVIGSYGPKANAFLAFEATTPPLGDLKCGTDLLRTMVYVQPKAQDYFYNAADITLGRSCPATGG